MEGSREGDGSGHDPLGGLKWEENAGLGAMCIEILSPFSHLVSLL